MATQLLAFAKHLARSRAQTISWRSLASESRARELHSKRCKTSELQNGVKVVTEGTAGATATVAVHLDCGSRNERETDSGVANLALHALLQATNRRSRQQLEAELRQMGAELSASTERERTRIAITCLSGDVAQAVDILGDVVSSPRLAAEDVAAAKREVAQEMRALDADCETQVMNGLHAMAFQNTPLALPSVGKAQTIVGLNERDLRNHVNKHVRGPRVVVAGAGAVDHSHVAQLAEQHLGAIPVAYDQSEIPMVAHARYTGSDLRIRDDAMAVAHIAIALEGSAYQSKDHLPLQLASELMGAWDRTHGGGTDCSSYLALCGATSQLALAFRAFNLSYSETGLFGVYAVCERMKHEDLLWHLTYEWKRLCTQLTHNELVRAKNRLFVRAVRRSEGSRTLASEIADQVLSYGRRVAPEELRAQLESVGAERVREVCNEYIWDRCPVVCALGPVEQLEDYDVLRGKFYWFRY